MSQTPLRFAILGFGHHAIKRLVPAFAQAEQAQLVGLWRRDQEKARANAEELGIPQVFATREALLASPDVDVVFITSPDAMHLDDCLACFAAGKAVLCEKPLAMNLGEARTIADAATKAGVPFGIGQNFRYNQTVDWLREKLASGAIGQVQQARGEYCYPAGNSTRAWIADPTLATGGPMADVGVHLIDALRYVLAAEPISVSTVARKDTREAKVEAVGNLQMEFSSGGDDTLPPIYAGVTVSSRAPYRTLLEVTGSDGVLIVENALSLEQPVDCVLRRGGHVVETVSITNDRTFANMLDSFAAFVRGTGTFRGTPADALQNMAALDAAYRSWHSGQRERIVPL
jgi:1,5-anhydro-D-fructose reductase (1,5-anhydro-D-mannitol-forming)